MSKKILSTVLAVAMIGAMSTNVMASEVEPNPTTEILPESENRIVTFIETLDKELYVGSYYENEMPHIIPVQNRVEDLDKEINKKSRSFDITGIVIDQPTNRSNADVYSRADLENGHKYIVKNMNDLKVDAVGYTADKLSVYMKEGATQTDIDKVLYESPTKALIIKEGGFLKDGLDSINTSIIEPKISSTDLRGGNRMKPNNQAYTTTIAISAVRNWNGTSGDIGFLTCGHSVSNGGGAYVNGVNVGIADVRYYNNMDVSFVNLSNANLNSHGYMKDGTQVIDSAARSQLAIGTTIKKHAIGAGATNGIVKEIGITGNWGGYYYNNLILTSVTTKNGDSGAPFVINNGATIAGIMIGALGTSPKIGDIYQESVMLPIWDIREQTGFIPCR